MKMSILVVGRLKDPYLKEGIDLYLKRIERYTSLSLVRIKEEKKRTLRDEAPAIAIEGRKVLHHIGSDDFLIGLTEEGKAFSSLSWASHMQRILDTTRGKVHFVIGSGAGLSPEVKKRANLLLSLSSMTFPHQMALLFFLEQLYRSWTILKNEPYHR